MSNYTNRKTEQLGMSHSTARSKLVKLLMFDMLKRLDEDTCFKCETKILGIDDLSIEHKEPWVDVSPDLFWDLNNIAFSHLKCNRPDRPFKIYASVEERRKAEYQRMRNNPETYQKRLETNRRWYSKMSKNNDSYLDYLERKKINQRKYDNASVI